MLLDDCLDDSSHVSHVRGCVGLYRPIAFHGPCTLRRFSVWNQWRTGEGTLILLGVLGGWPGAIVAQQLFHHKTKKRSFQIAFWLTVLLHCFGFVLLLSLWML